MISDKSGQLKLLAAVEGVVRLTRLSGAPISDMAQYEQAVKRSGVAPTVTVFVHGQAELKIYLPLLKRWFQADLLGFNADCGKPDLARTCKLAEQIAVSTTVYVIAADGSLRRIDTPGGEAAAVSLRSFVQ